MLPCRSSGRPSTPPSVWHTWHTPPKGAASNLLDLLISVPNLKTLLSLRSRLSAAQGVGGWMCACKTHGQAAQHGFTNSVPSHTRSCIYKEGFGAVRRCA